VNGIGQAEQLAAFLDGCSSLGQHVQVPLHRELLCLIQDLLDLIWILAHLLKQDQGFLYTLFCVHQFFSLLVYFSAAMCQCAPSACG
jgi:hypothetical protein